MLARCTISAESPVLGKTMSTGCALIVDRPGRGHLAIFGPFGATLLTAQTDGTGLAVELPRDERFLQGDLAGELARATGGAVTVDDLVGALVGDPAQMEGTPEIEVTYGPYVPREEDGALLPSAVHVSIVPLELTLHVEYRSWSTPDPVPEVFGQTPSAEGVVKEDLWEALPSWGSLGVEGEPR